jgi:cation diffusion facilitator family transporter
MGCSLHDHGHGHGHGHGGHGHSHLEGGSHSHENLVKSRVENLNVRAAMIHVISDFVQSCGVFVAALVIYFKPDWHIIDPICTFFFSVLVLITTINILKDALLVSELMVLPRARRGVSERRGKIDMVTMCFVSLGGFTAEAEVLAGGFIPRSARPVIPATSDVVLALNDFK